VEDPRRPRVRLPAGQFPVFVDDHDFAIPEEHDLDGVAVEHDVEFRAGELLPILWGDFYLFPVYLVKRCHDIGV